MSIKPESYVLAQIAETAVRSKYKRVQEISVLEVGNGAFIAGFYTTESGNIVACVGNVNDPVCFYATTSSGFDLLQLNFSSVPNSNRIR